MKTKAWAFIPARLESKRLPGKLLLKAAGKTILQHTYESVSKCNSVSRTIIATDNLQIQQTALEFGAEVVMTGPADSGTARIAEAASNMQLQEAEIIVNVQADEPEIAPKDIDLAINELVARADCQISTLAAPISTWEEAADPALVKVVCDYQKRALLFSRLMIPHCRENKSKKPPAGAYLGHVGLYCFRKAALQLYSKLQPPVCEQLEQLEQLRALHYGLPIAVALLNKAPKGIDTEQDYLLFKSRMQ